MNDHNRYPQNNSSGSLYKVICKKVSHPWPARRPIELKMTVDTHNQLKFQDLSTHYVLKKTATPSAKKLM